MASLCLATNASAATNNKEIPSVSELDKASQELMSHIIKLQGKRLALQREIQHPPQTRWTVFLTLTKKAEANNGKILTLTDVRLELDGNRITSQEYSTNERRALRYGGADQLYIGSLKSSRHRATVTIGGQYKGKRFHRTTKITFKKTDGPRIMWIRIRPRAHSSGSAALGISVKHVNDLP